MAKNKFNIHSLKSLAQNLTCGQKLPCQVYCYFGVVKAKKLKKAGEKHLHDAKKRRAKKKKVTKVDVDEIYSESELQKDVEVKRKQRKKQKSRDTEKTKGKHTAL